SPEFHRAAVHSPPRGPHDISRDVLCEAPNGIKHLSRPQRQRPKTDTARAGHPTRAAPPPCGGPKHPTPTHPPLDLEPDPAQAVRPRPRSGAGNAGATDPGEASEGAVEAPSDDERGAKPP